MTIARDKIRPNPWNANAFDPDNYPKLIESLRDRGIMEPLKVMPDPDAPGWFLLVDGYHRWLAAEILDIADLPCEVWDISIEEAKIRGLQLNYLRGQPVPQRLAALLHDLNAEQSVEDLAKILPWSAGEIEQAMEIMRLPPDLQERLDREAADQSARAPVPVTVILVGPEFDRFEQAMATAKNELGHNAWRGQCLARICEAYILDADQSGGDAQSDEPRKAG
jgi:ParB/RepB/Spo0J family partition protein